MSCYNRVIGDTLLSRTEPGEATEVVIAVYDLNRMLELGRPKSVRIACPLAGYGLKPRAVPSMQHGRAAGSG